MSTIAYWYMLKFEPPHICLSNNSTWTCSKLPFKFPKPQSIIAGRIEDIKEMTTNYNYRAINNIKAKCKLHNYLHKDNHFSNTKIYTYIATQINMAKENHLLNEHLPFPSHESNTFMVLSNSLDFSMLLVTKRYVSPLSKFTLTSQKNHI